MATNYGNAFHSPDQKQYPGSVVPVWLEVKERKTAGGTFDISGYKKGDIIPAGIAVRLDKMGGNATILPTFTVAEALTSGTSVVLKANGIAPAKDMVVGKMTAAGQCAKAATLGIVTYDATTNTYSCAISANSLGNLDAGDILVIASEAGNNKAAVLPNGLSWRQVVIDSDNATVGTVAVVTKGQVLGDRIPAMPEFYKAAMPGITFEYEA